MFRIFLLLKFDIKIINFRGNVFSSKVYKTGLVSFLDFNDLLLKSITIYNWEISKVNKHSLAC